MSDENRRIFDDEQVKKLMLGYLYSRGGDVPAEDIHAFLNACVKAVTIGQSVNMAADGMLLISWDKETGIFSFGLSAKGLTEAEEKFGHLEVSG